MTTETTRRKARRSPTARARGTQAAGRAPGAESAAQARAADNWRKALRADEELAKDTAEVIAEAFPARADSRIELCPDLRSRIGLALCRVEEDACWATARSHPKFSRIYGLADFAALALGYATRALESANVAAPSHLSERGKRKLDRAVSKAERMALLLEEAGLASVLRDRPRKGGNTKQAKAEAARGWTDLEMVKTFNEFRARHPGRSGRATSVSLTAKKYKIDPHRVNRLLRAKGQC